MYLSACLSACLSLSLPLLLPLPLCTARPRLSRWAAQRLVRAELGRVPARHLGLDYVLRFRVLDFRLSPAISDFRR